MEHAQIVVHLHVEGSILCGACRNASMNRDTATTRRCKQHPDSLQVCVYERSGAYLHTDDAHYGRDTTIYL